MTRAEMLAELKYVLGESNIAYGSWADATLEGYLAEGQDKFCEETGYFRDISNFTITLQTDVAVYAVPDRIIQVLDIWDGLRKLGKVLTGNETYSYDSGFPFNTDAVGVPTMWATDEETGVIKLSPTPTSAENGRTLVLHVWRYSLYDLAGDGAVPEGGGDAPPASPEIPSRFQRACIEWAAHKALVHHDLDSQDKVKSQDHLKSFMDYVADGITAFRRGHNIDTRVGISPAYRS